MAFASLHRLCALLVGAPLLALFCASANAAEVLFKDDLRFASNNKTLDDINNDAQDRQKGRLAPAVYSSNGAGWQCKTNVDLSGNSGIRLFPSANRIPLVLSPAWKLSKEPGKYSLALQIRPRSWTDSEEPEKILIAVGTSESDGMVGVPPDLANAVVIEMNVDRANNAFTLQVLFDQSQVAPPVKLSNLSGLVQPYDVTIRWKQTASRQVESLLVEVDGIKVFNLPKAAFVLQGEAVLFGGQVGPNQEPKSQFADMSVLGIQYVKE